MIAAAVDIWLVTAYCLGVKGCGASNPRTTAKTVPYEMSTAACDPDVLPRHSTFRVDGLPQVWRCEDTGGAVNGQHVDLYFGRGEKNKKKADDWGRKWRKIRVLSRPDRPANEPPENERHRE